MHNVLAFLRQIWSTLQMALTGVLLTPTLEISVPGPLGLFCGHNETQWQISSNPLFIGPLVYDSGFTAADTITIPSGNLSLNTTYYWRSRIKDVEFFPFTDEISPWSAVRSFTTLNLIPFPPLPLLCNWPTISNSAPADGESGVSITPTLQVTTGFGLIPLCSHDFTQWQISTSPLFFGPTIIYDSGDDAVNLNSFPVPGGTLSGLTTYHWRARFKSGGGDVSGWTTPTQFTTQLIFIPLLCNWPTISNSAPANGAVGVSTTPTLQVTTGLGLIPLCSHDFTQWQISTNPLFLGAPTFDSGDDAVNLNSINIPGGTLSGATLYYWRARFKSGGGDVSNWTAVTSFTTGFVPVLPCNWGIVSNTLPADGATGLSLTPTLQIGQGPALLPACSHDFTQWQIATDAGMATIVFDSGDDALNLLTLTVPAGVLTLDTIFYWRARLKSGGGDVSGWSTVTRFRTLAPAPGNAPPNANFSFAPSNPFAGQNVQFTDLSTDPNGAGDIVLRSWDYGDGNTSNVQNPTHAFASAATFTVRLTVTDSAGQTGTVVKNITVSAAPGPGPGLLTIDQAIASLVPNDPSQPNADQIIGDREIVRAIQLWITGTPVPNTGGQTISDTKILDLIAKWIGSITILSASAETAASPALLAQARDRLPELIDKLNQPVTVQPLQLDTVRLHKLDAHRWRFGVSGYGIERVSIEVYDTSGRLLLEQSQWGHQLDLSAFDAQGQPLANGLYLYVITAFGYDNHQVRSEVRKWAILR